MNRLKLKHALGLAVSGTEVRLAHLTNNKGQIQIEGLERAKLANTLEQQPAPAASGGPAEAETRDVFGLKDAFGLKDSLGERGAGETTYKQDNANLEVLYQLLQKYTQRKVKIAFNLPLSMVTYQRESGPQAGTPPGERVPSPEIGIKRLKSRDGTLALTYDKHPPTLSLLREVNSFVKGNLFLALMDTTEVALANLARTGSELRSDKITVIIYIEDDFTRLVFLHGKDLFHVSSIIHEGVASPENLEVIYRKLIYEQDEAEIPEISTILLAGKSSRIKARDFFAGYFENATVRYLTSTSNALGNFPANEMQGQTFSEFAVPIALAWKLLDPKNPDFIPLNLLPQDLIDQQQVLKLNYTGYALLAITGLTAFFFTWQIVQSRREFYRLQRQNVQLELQIQSNQSTVDRVLDIENEINRLSKHLALSDSLSRKHDEFITFLQKLNRSVGSTGGLWIDEIAKQPDGFMVRGTATNRAKVPLLAEKLEQANLRRMTRADSSEQRLVTFELERRQPLENVEFVQNGIRIIDASQFAGGNLVLTKGGRDTAADKQGATAAPALAANAPATPPPAAPSQSAAAGTTRPAVSRATEAGAAQRNARRPTNQVERMAESRVAPANGSATQPRAANTGGVASTTGKRQPTMASAQRTIPNRAPVAGASSAAAAAEIEDSALAGRVEAMTCQTRDLAEWYAAGYRKRGTDAIVVPHFDQRQGMQYYRVMISKPAGRNPVAEDRMVHNASRATGVTNGPSGNPHSTGGSMPSSTAMREENYGDKVEAITCHTRELAEWYAAGYRKRGIEAVVAPYFDKAQGMEVYRVLIKKPVPKLNNGQETPQPRMAATTGSRPPARGYTIEATAAVINEPVEDIVTTYRKQGMEVTIERYRDAQSQQPRYRLLIGTFATREAAERKAAEIGNLFIKSYRIVMLK
ncbi:MAG: hypothetical protein ONB48_09295 [candidate division KSB1 bacterium]|nr:hypothetical protein [candidate division KSB1 bacterium]MDZ7273682.1 hypothetical protein [candidate division KSB1 bacterium]MDZ7285838.1 hypothetical protein [candidate division KSB1 bacterium]MDZ7298870.1 hypothetical protein [candidate division KSB1 bacterium]MDZ7307084.1 hypothetical protein [candidate division KSB1 bacterium]